MINLLRASATALLIGACATPALHAADDAAFFTDSVWPIIQQSCVDCHGEKKQKSKLRLDSREGWLKGGSHGVSVVEGDPSKSDVIKMISRTHEDADYHMPPKKDKALTPEQVKIIEEWIKKGLPWGK
jgi:mono/diheme cytochrome c family protein